MKINDITISLHCGCSEEIVEKQITALKPLEDKYTVGWNNRINRHPEVYPSYSQLINHAVATSGSEWLILINDRTHPRVEEVEKMIHLLENGFACVLLYNVGFMGFSKELVRTIGWWDERFLGGGWEDRDWVWRIRQADLALYESQEAVYDMSWKSPLNFPWDDERDKRWKEKYDTSNPNIAYKLLKEEEYPHWNKTIGPARPDIKQTWKSWKDSILNIMYDKPGSGTSSSTLLGGREIEEK